MLQIIGWMGCLYLIIKALELYSTSKARQNEDGNYDAMAMIAGAIALLGGVGFFIILNGQIDSMPY